MAANSIITTMANASLDAEVDLATSLHALDEDSSEHDLILDEDFQSAIGISISPAQTRLTSPLTSMANAAILVHDDGDEIIYESANDVHLARSDSDLQDRQAISLHWGTSERQGAYRRKSASSEPKFPSPWTSTPKLFEEQLPVDHCPPLARSRAASGPMSVLENLNVKRFISSFQVLSLPKSASFKDFSLTNIPFIFSGSKQNPPLQKTGARRRANTSFAPSSNQDSRDGLLRGPANYSGTDSTSSVRAPHLRRAESDQSLMLRHVVSTGSSLGDDSRWEHVQGQVNSRFKAIVDSFQDSGVKLPSLPNLSNLNFNNFRLDLSRIRASSESKASTRGDGKALNIFTDPYQNSDKSAQLKPIATPDPNTSHNAPKHSRTKSPHLDQALELLTGDVVIMGGYRGSVLRSATPPNRQLWVPVKVGLNIRKVNLEVGLSPADEEKMEETIYASEMLTHIGPVDMGRRLLKRLRTCANARQGKLVVHEYGYDWRLSPHLLSRRLVDFLENLPSNKNDVPTGKRGATVIAHSLGGLITRHAVNKRPELFAGILYVGVPQYCVNILGPLRNGDEVLLSSRVLTAQVNFTFRTSFLLLPEDGKCFVNKQTKEVYPVDFFDIEDWKKYAFSPCVAPVLPAPMQNGFFSSVSKNFSSLPLPIKRASFSPASSNHGNIKLENPGSLAAQSLDPHLKPADSNASVSLHCTIPLPVALSYLQRTLASTHVFKQELKFQPAHAAPNRYPPLSVLYSTSVPTVRAARVSSREAIRRADAYDDLAFGSGDGVCLAKAAMLPEGYACVQGGRVRTERGHIGLLGDLDAVGKCLIAIMEARTRGVGLGIDEASTS